jgi:hypothetical protein
MKCSGASGGDEGENSDSEKSWSTGGKSGLPVCARENKRLGVGDAEVHSAFGGGSGDSDPAGAHAPGTGLPWLSSKFKSAVCGT